MKDLIAELQWRGMIHQTMPGLEEQLSKEMTSGYIGFDPTANSLHIGNLATIMLLKQLQLAGHKPYALVGGATGMVGDPSGKSAERNLLDEETLRYNQDCIKKQLEKFLDFDCGDNSAVMVNNYDWFKEFDFLGFLRDVGKHITVNYMMAKDSVKNRLETGISFTEFSYQLLQGYDFYHLYKEHDVRLQMGGSDQWGNITTGTELIRRMGGGSAFALTCPLVTKADGTKFGKSEAGNVWLDPELTSPYAFYQFWLNVTDEDAPKLIRVFTLYTQEEIEAFEKEHAEAPHLRVLQHAIANEVTTRVHGKVALEGAKAASQILFNKKATFDDLKSIDLLTWKGIAKELPLRSVSKDQLGTVEEVADLLSNTTENLIFKSKGEATRMIKGGGVRINKDKVADPKQGVDFELVHDRYMLVQVGKRFFLIEAE
ncbi:MAG: tyrosine--tRNA ligase [Flammeovirgaceae bacterium]